MGIFGALTTSVAGMRAQSFALENISGNIANSQTTAFKRIDTSFEDLIPSDSSVRQLAGSVASMSRATNTVQGDIQSSSISTFMAVNGEGFFVVSKPTGFSDTGPTFDGVPRYTRRGDFQPDKNGYLVNGAGYYLMGIPIDATTGNATGSTPQLLKFQTDFLPAQATTTVNYRANLSNYPLTAAHDTAIAGSELINPVNFTANPLAVSPQPAKITGTGATLLPDAQAVGTGTVAALTNGTTIASLTITAGQTFSVSDGTNTTTYTATAGDDMSDILTALNGGTAAISASLDPTGHLKIQSNNYINTLTMSGTAATALGFGGGNASFTPTNLLTQSAASQGQTLSITIPSVGSAQTITFGTGVGQVATLAQLNTALGALSGVNASVNTANGNMVMTAQNLTDTITLGGTLTSSVFGLHTTSALPSNQTVVANDLTAFLNQSIGGGAVTTYDVSGAPVNLQIRWAKTDSYSLGAGHTDTWNMFYQVDSSATGTQTAWKNAGVDFKFDPNGQMNPVVSNLSLSNVTVEGINLGTLSMSFGAGGLTQFSDTNGSVQVNMIQQNGYAAGSLQSVGVNDKGRVVGSYSNGRTLDLAEIPLAKFNGTNFLRRIDGGAFETTDGSGAAILGAPGKVVSSSLEGSNTDIADEFTKLIVTQQAYSANTRVITTSNTMVQDLLNMLR